MKQHTSLQKSETMLVTDYINNTQHTLLTLHTKKHAYIVSNAVILENLQSIFNVLISYQLPLTLSTTIQQYEIHACDVILGFMLKGLEYYVHIQIIIISVAMKTAAALQY